MTITATIVLMAASAVAASAVTALLARRAHRARAAEAREIARRGREEERTALMGAIASGLAHEIRNPLSTLSLNLQLLREDWSDPITERENRGTRKIDVLLKEVGRLEDILNAFLRFAAGHRLKKERVVLNDIVRELLEFTAPQIARSRIRVHRRFDPDLPPVHADSNLIRQALLNLILNAIQAMPEGGELEIRTEPGPRAARVRVRDTGVGIAPEHRDKIFNLYFSTKPSGTGLGLPMARKIVEEHEGTIEVEGAPGRGSTFTISLPTLDAQDVPRGEGLP